jgi:hypothetical protein
MCPHAIRVRPVRPRRRRRRNVLRRPEPAAGCGLQPVRRQEARRLQPVQSLRRQGSLQPVQPLRRQKSLQSMCSRQSVQPLRGVAPAPENPCAAKAAAACAPLCPVCPVCPVRGGLRAMRAMRPVRPGRRRRCVRRRDAGAVRLPEAADARRLPPPGGHFASGRWGDWEHFSTRGYVSDTHGGRFVHNAANDLAAEEYGKYEEVRRMPVGSILAKPSFTVAPDGRASLGPLFLMEKMTRNWNSETADWRYAMINADGSTFGITGGQNSDGMGSATNATPPGRMPTTCCSCPRSSDASEPSRSRQRPGHFGPPARSRRAPFGSGPTGRRWRGAVVALGAGLLLALASASGRHRHDPGFA